MGRPTKYDPKFCDIVVREMQEGASKTEVCATLGISRDAFYKYQEKYEEFNDAIKKGDELSEAWWLKQGRIHLENSKFNSTLWYMNMKNRHGWKDKQEQNVTITTGGDTLREAIAALEAANPHSAKILPQ